MAETNLITCLLHHGHENIAWVGLLKAFVSSVKRYGFIRTNKIARLMAVLLVVIHFDDSVLSLGVWWIRRVTCFTVNKISSDPSQAQVNQRVI